MYTNIFFEKSLIVILQLNENIIILMQINAIIKWSNILPKNKIK
jgi:hypothetical protein